MGGRRRSSRHLRALSALAILAGIVVAPHQAANANGFTIDFGDAPSGYPVTVAQDGARHSTTGDPGLYLGSGVDAEADGQPSTGADGDDTNGIDDEDGIGFLDAIGGSPTSTLTVTASKSGYLSAWFDFNADQAW